MIGDGPQDRRNVNWRVDGVDSVERVWSKQSLVGAALVSVLAGACGGGGPRRQSGNGGDRNRHRRQRRRRHRNRRHDARDRLRLHLRASTMPRVGCISPRSATSFTTAAAARNRSSAAARACPTPARGPGPGRSTTASSRSFTATCWRSGAAPRTTSSPAIRGAGVIWWNGATWQLASDFGVKVTTISGSSRSDVWFGLGDGTVWQLVGTDLTRHQVAGGAISALTRRADGRVRVRFDHLLALGRPVMGHEHARGHRRRGRVRRPGRSPLGGQQPRLDGSLGRTGVDRGVHARQRPPIPQHPRHRRVAHLGGGRRSSALRRQQLVDGRGSGQLLGYYTSVWPAGAKDVWAVGTEGLIQHGDGQFFDTQPSPTTTDPVSLWGSGPADIWAGGGERHDAPLHRRPLALTRRRGDSLLHFASR